MEVRITLKEESHINLETVFVMLTSEENSLFLKRPPESYNVGEILEKMKVPHPRTEFAKEKNNTIEMLGKQVTELYCSSMWSYSCQIVLQNALENTPSYVSTKQWTEISR